MIFVEESELAEAIEDLIDNVAAGEEVCITRFGKVVARLYPCDGTE